MSNVADPTTLTLCTITYLRPTGLRRLLERLALLDVGGLDVDVVIVDNDEARSAEDVVIAARTDHPLELRYVVEPTRGITHARNTALDTAFCRQPQWIGWIDDDEAPDPRWLVNLMETQASTGADVVLGPSVPIYEQGTASWIVDTGGFERERFATATEFPFFHARTSGVIVRSAVLRTERFDHRLALTGGSDRLLFTRLHRAGAKFVWDDRAVVSEWIPRSRASVRWMIRRWFRIGVTRSLTMLILDDPTWPRRFRRVAGGLRMAALGTFGLIVALPRGRAARLRACRPILLGLGASYGALGGRYEEYRKVHGR